MGRWTRARMFYKGKWLKLLNFGVLGIPNSWIINSLCHLILSNQMMIPIWWMSMLRLRGVKVTGLRFQGPWLWSLTLHTSWTWFHVRLERTSDLTQSCSSHFGPCFLKSWFKMFFILAKSVRGRFWRFIKFLLPLFYLLMIREEILLAHFIHLQSPAWVTHMGVCTNKHVRTCTHTTVQLEQYRLELRMCYCISVVDQVLEMFAWVLCTGTRDRVARMIPVTESALY